MSLTFDDGNSIQYEKFYPILAELDMKATFYIVTGQIGKPGKMTWDELKRLYAGGNEIGSHTNTHPHLTILPTSELDLELGTSKSLLKPFGCTTLAYPFGEYNDKVSECAKRYYTAARSYPDSTTRDIGYNCQLMQERYALKVFPTERALPSRTAPLLDLPSPVFRRAIQQLVETAIQKHAWLIFVFHGTGDMSPGNVVDNIRKRFRETMSYARHVHRLRNDLMHYYGGIQTKKFEWMCQYLVSKDDVRTLTVSRVVQCWGLGKIAEA